jgi:hypothetical protein
MSFFLGFGDELLKLAGPPADLKSEIRGDVGRKLKELKSLTSYMHRGKKPKSVAGGGAHEARPSGIFHPMSVRVPSKIQRGYTHRSAKGRLLGAPFKRQK